MQSQTTDVDYDEVRCLVNDAAQSNFFRGLVSSRLGNDRSLDDEVVDLIVTNQVLIEVFDEFCCTESGRAKIDKALEDIFAKLRPAEKDKEAKTLQDSREYKPGDDDACRVVWMQAVSDPRFDIILKEAIDDSKLPPPVVRGSSLSRIMGLLDRIRAGLASGTTRHTDAVLAASIIAALLAGGAGVKVFNSIDAPSAATADKASIEAIARDLHTIAGELHKGDLHDQQITNLDSQITQNNEEITNLQQEFNTQYAELSKRITSVSSDQIQQLQMSVASLTNSVVETNNDLRLTNGNVNRLQGQVSVSEQLKDSLRQIAYGIGPPQGKDNGLLSVRASLSTMKEPLQQIAYGIGPPQGEDNGLPSVRASFSAVKEPLQQIAYGIGPPQEKDSGLPSLRASSQQIALDLAPAPDSLKHDLPEKTATSGATTKPVANGGASSNSSSVPSTIAASLKALENDVRTSDKSFYREFSIGSTASDATLKKADGQDCKVTWALISLSAQNAMIQIRSNDCGIDLPNNSKVVLDHTRTAFPGTNLEFSFERPDHIRFWPLAPKGAIVSVYQNPAP